VKFYRVNFFGLDPSEQTTEWATSVAAAEKIARDNRCGDYEPSVTPVEVPTDKAGLLAFLNEHIWSHPGAQKPYGG
jgi:hypothetical protein